MLWMIIYESRTQTHTCIHTHGGLDSCPIHDFTHVSNAALIHNDLPILNVAASPGLQEFLVL